MEAGLARRPPQEEARGGGRLPGGGQAHVRLNRSLMVRHFKHR